MTKTLIGLVAAVLVVALTGCGGQSRSQKEAALCHSTRENPVLFDKVLIGGQPASNFPESALTPATLVTEKLGKPDQVLYLKGNALFSWWRYGNTAYMIASLAADRPGHDYIATKSCDWSLTQKRAGIGHAQFGEYLDAGSLVGLFQANGLGEGRGFAYGRSEETDEVVLRLDA